MGLCRAVREDSVPLRFRLQLDGSTRLGDDLGGSAELISRVHVEASSEFIVGRVRAATASWGSGWQMTATRDSTEWPSTKRRVGQSLGSPHSLGEVDLVIPVVVVVPVVDSVNVVTHAQ